MNVALVILDGWGLRESTEAGGRNAIAAASTPRFDRFRAAGASTTLQTDGRAVGLPDDQMGNSEVGHLTIGAGRVVKQPYARIEDTMEAGELDEVDAIAHTLEHVSDTGGRLHLLGLVSDGGVHSDQRHLHSVVETAASHDIEAVTHAFTDGRDTSPTGGEQYLDTLEAVADEHGTGSVGTVSGRYYAMDRDQNWERTKRAFDAIVERRAAYRTDSPVEAVTNAYDRGDTDEFVEPTLIEGEPALEAGDGVIFCNFRADRARQLTRLLADIDSPLETRAPPIRMTTMTEYDSEFDLPVAFPPNQPTETLGELLATHGRTQLRMAESEKYPHVTYFLNGGREPVFEGEQREIVESPDVPTYDEQPAMSAPELTDTAIELLESEAPDVLVLNYANPDMVGHTGDFDAAVEAVETVDSQAGRLVERCHEAGGHVLLTADHGNADDMGTEREPHTAHTFNPVPFVSLPSAAETGGESLRDGGTLSDVTPTILSLLDIEKPRAMDGESLFE